MSILNDIVQRKRTSIAEAKRKRPLSGLKSAIRDLPEARDFNKAIKRAAGAPLNVIAELKKASPSKGVIRDDFNPSEIGRLYERKGAAAISVLTEEDFFQGSLAYLKLLSETVHVPLLRKDFIVDEYQIYEARAGGADSVLLIAAVLEKSQSEEFLQLAGEIGLQVLFEVRHWKELEKVLVARAEIIGINNRDLKTFNISLETTIGLLKDIPENKVVVTESGIRTREDVEFFSRTRVDAVLVGTALMSCADIGQKYDELFSTNDA